MIERLWQGQADCTALVLSGGGARAAYQVGVLAAVGELLPEHAANPFPIICGSSAGAINAVGLATNADDFPGGVERMLRVWSQFSCDQVYRTDLAGLVAQAWRWTRHNLLGVRSQAPTALLDNRPLRDLLGGLLELPRIEAALQRGQLRAVSVSAFGYQSAESVCFYQGHERIRPWVRHRRTGVQTPLQLDHLMASAAIPLLFPSVRISHEWFGDGAVRQRSPISPALHLGANRVLVVGVSDNPVHAVSHASRQSARGRPGAPPSLAQLGGHLLNSTFVDNLEADIEQIERMNRLARLVPGDAAPGSDRLREVEVLVISPSQPLDLIAARHRKTLPVTLRAFLRGSGATRASGGSLVSYLLFEAAYCQELIALGRRDALARSDQLRQFLRLA